MNIIISNSKGIPIYEQIIDQIKNQIISEKLIEGEILPSIRNLAKDLKISVITTKRAYTELENSGYIYTVPGKGSYVAKKDMDIIRHICLKEIEANIKKAIKLSESYNISKDDLIEILNTLYMEDKNECN